MKKIIFVVFAVSMAFTSCSNSSDSATFYPNAITTGTQNPTEGTTTSPNNPNPSGDENGGGQNENGGENNNGNENQNGSGGGSSTTLAANECDMGCDFDLAYYADKIYVNGTSPRSSTYDSEYKKIAWWNSQIYQGVYLYIHKEGNKLVVEKNPHYAITRLFNILKVEKTSDDRIDVTIEQVSEN